MCELFWIIYLNTYEHIGGLCSTFVWKYLYTAKVYTVPNVKAFIVNVNILCVVCVCFWIERTLFTLIAVATQAEATEMGRIICKHWRGYGENGIHIHGIIALTLFVRGICIKDVVQAVRSGQTTWNCRGPDWWYCARCTEFKNGNEIR